MFDFFKKNQKQKEDLEKALSEGLLTEEEFLRLKSDRADRELKNYLLKNKSKK